ncbi:MAG: hypothetical protein RLZZ214_2148 [Verrucomicrobiota bacterium]
MGLSPVAGELNRTAFAGPAHEYKPAETETPESTPPERSQISEDDRVSTGLKLAFATGVGFENFATQLPTGTLFLPFFNIGLGLNPALLGVLLMVFRVWDAVSDAVYCDRQCSIGIGVSPALVSSDAVGYHGRRDPSGVRRDGILRLHLDVVGAVLRLVARNDPRLRRADPGGGLIHRRRKIGSSRDKRHVTPVADSVVSRCSRSSSSS